MGEIAQKIRDLSIKQWGMTGAVDMVGDSPKLLELQKKIVKVASFLEPVLITGESGVGKESVAQALFLLGGRTGRPFVSVNCPQYREGNLTVSELFGHKKGSFTGAVADRPGCFETANGGVIFLDEIGDLHMSAQVMLLRALAKGEFQPLGADYTRTVNVRVVAATNRPLDALVVREQFRHDLFFRLQYFLLNVPPLRERGEDWYQLIDYSLQKLYEKYGVRKRFSAASLRIIEQYQWPGNVRELMSVTTMGYAMSDRDVIEPRDFASLLATGSDQTESRSDALYRRMVVDGESFWNVIHERFLARDLNRVQVKAVIRRGLFETGGSYRRLLELFAIEESSYQRFMDFLRHHDLKP